MDPRLQVSLYFRFESLTEIAETEVKTKKLFIFQMTVVNRIWNNLIIKWQLYEDPKRSTWQNYTQFQAALGGERRLCLPESTTYRMPKSFMSTTTEIIFVPMQSPKQYILPPLPLLLPVGRSFQIIEKGSDNKTSVEPLPNLGDFCQPIQLTRN